MLSKVGNEARGIEETLTIRNSVSFLPFLPLAGAAVREKWVVPRAAVLQVRSSLECVLTGVRFSLSAPGQLSGSLRRSPFCQPTLVHPCPVHAHQAIP